MSDNNANRTLLELGETRNDVALQYMKFCLTRIEGEAYSLLCSSQKEAVLVLEFLP